MPGFGWFETLAKDVRYGLRMLFRSPGFTAVAALSLALGIGANTALFSVMDALMFRMLPVKNAGRMIRPRSPLSYPAYRKIRDQSKMLDGFFAFTLFPASVRVGEEAEQSAGQLVSGNFYSVLGVNAVLGRVLTPEDDSIPGVGGPQGPVAVISYQFWQRRFALDRNVLGKTITFNGVAVTIVGVTPQPFFGVIQTLSPDVTAPMMLQPRVTPSTSTELWAHGDEGSFLDYDGTDNQGPPYMAVLKPGVTIAQAQAEMNVLYQQILAARAGSQLTETKRQEDARQKIELTPAGNGFALFDAQTRMLLIFVMVAIPGVVLLIACANVANLLLARAAAREKEVAVRLAIGAGRFRLMRQLLTESLLLALLGGALGLALAGWGRRMLLAWITARVDAPLTIQAETDSRVLAFTLGVSALAALLFGLAPAFRATKADLASMLKEGGRGSGGGRGWEAGKVLVAAQVALSLLLLICAGLFIRTVRNMRTLDPGYDRHNLYLVSANFLGYKGPRSGAAVKEIWERTSSMPGARAVGITQDLPPYGRHLKVTVEGYTRQSGEEMYVDRLLVGPGFLEAMGIPLLAGRTITLRDNETAPKVCVASSAMARTFFADSNPIGRRFTFQRTGAEYEAEIVGVVKDVQKADAKETIYRAVYCPLLQDLPVGGAILVIRAAGDPAAVIAEARRQFHAVDPNLFLTVKTMDRAVDDTLFFQRFLATLASVFSVLALVLAAVGLYGVMAYSVARRTNEIGIRMALGADRGTVIGMVVAETMRLVGAGLFVGLAAAWAATRLISSILFGLTAMDPLAIAAAVLVMAAVALVSGYIPAHRAADVDPMFALRHE